MVDIANALVFCASSPLVIKVLGPTADYLGEGIKKFSEKRVENLQRIFRKAEKKLDSQNITGGEVPPRILQHILNEGSYVNDELSADYFSGVLASSKSTISRDDRSITFIKTLNGMSNYEIRFHYILYSTYRQVFCNSKDVYLSKTDQAQRLVVYIPDTSIANSLALETGENINEILEHSIPNLVNRGLIGSNYRFGSKEWIQEAYKSIEGAGLISCPTLLGAQLFLAAHGYLGISGNNFCSPDLKLSDLDDIRPCPGAFHVK